MNLFETVYKELFENGDLNLLECDGGCAGGDAGGGAAAGGDAGGGAVPAGGVSSGDVLGPDGNFENGKGCMGKDDFHVPFPVMPCLFRWPTNWIGGSQKKRKKNGKTVSVKNPYVKGMKTIVAEAEAFDYQGSARKEFEMIAAGTDNTYGGVLNYNRAWKLAWAIGEEDGLLYVFKPVEKKDGRWTIYCSRLLPQGRMEYLFDRAFGDYSSESDAISGIWKEVQRHKELLREWLADKEKTIVDEAKFSPRDIMNWEAHGRDPRYFPRARGPEVNAFALQNELKRRFPHQFEDVEISNKIGRWTVTFKTVLPDGQREIRGQQRVATVIPQVNRIISFLRTRGVETNGYDVSAKAV